MVQHIIQTAEWKRPIYFATSVAPAKWKPYEQYLETQGLVMRLVPYQGNRMLNAFMMRRSFEDLFRFRGILTKDWQVDRSLYKEKDLNIILNNYAAGMYDLAREEWKAQDYAGAVRWTERSLRFKPNSSPRIMLGVFFAINNERQRRSSITATDAGGSERGGILAETRVGIFVRGISPRAPDDRRGDRHVPENRQLYIDGFRYAASMGMAISRRATPSAGSRSIPMIRRSQAAEDIERMARQTPSPSPGNRSSGAKRGT